MRFVLVLILMPLGALAQTVGDQRGYNLESPLLAPLVQAQAFSCAATTCSQIRSCEEACYKLKVCGHTRRDGDNDGIPCENLCSRRCP